MTKGLVWIPGKSSNFAEILTSLVDSWFVELPYDFQREYSLENCRDLRATCILSGADSSVFESALGEFPALDQDGARSAYWRTVDPTLEQKVSWETEAGLVFRTPPNLGGEHVAFWELSDRNLAKEVLWINGVSCSAGLASFMLSGDCDPSMLQSLANEVQAKRGFVQGGLLFDDAWARIAASCRLGVWFGRPDWDFSRNVLLTSAYPSVLEDIRSLAVAAGAKEVAGTPNAQALWRRDSESSCVCWVDIEAELEQYASP